MKQEDLKKVEQELNDEELNGVAGGANPWHGINPDDYPSREEIDVKYPDDVFHDLSNPD